MTIKKLRFTDMGPFDEIEFEFDEQVNVLTGPNNSGKSTALLVLAELLVYPFAVPTKLRRSNDPGWEMQYRTEDGVETKSGSFPYEAVDLGDLYETIGYTCFVPAQRHNSDFRSPGPIAGRSGQDVAQLVADQIIQAIPELLRFTDRDTIRHSILQESRSLSPELDKRQRLMLSGASLVSDNAFIQKMIDLDYAAYRLGQPNFRLAIEQIATVTSEITEGFPITFLGIAEDSQGLFPLFDTPDGQLPFDTLSQGTQSIIHLIARLVLGYAEYYDFPANFKDKPGIIIIDEIDAHCHPAWQRLFLRALTNQFPKLQVFCSTHSPLMLAGLGPGQVQLLRREHPGTVTVTPNPTDVVGWTADEVLRNLLEILDPTDIQTTKDFERLQVLQGKAELTETETLDLETLRSKLHRDMLSSPGTANIAEFAEKLKQSLMEHPL